MKTPETCQAQVLFGELIEFFVNGKSIGKSLSAGDGFRIKAVIGSPDVIYSSKEYKPLAFSFEETEDAVEVKDWEEIRKRVIDRSEDKDK